MSTGKSADSTGRYSDICGATNRQGEPCKLPAGWGTPGSGGSRCKHHGGASTGPSETSYLEENDFAEGNAGGGAPELNTNAAKSGAWADWRKAYERFDRETKAYLDRLRADMRKRAKEHAPDVDADRREELLKERATLSVLWDRAALDTLKRGWVIETTVEIDGVEYQTTKVNPTMPREHAICRRQRQIAKELRLWPGYQE